MSEKFKEQVQEHFKNATITEKGGYVCAHVEGELQAEDLLKATPLGFMKLKRSGSGVTLYFKDMYNSFCEELSVAMNMVLSNAGEGDGLTIKKAGESVLFNSSFGEVGIPFLSAVLLEDKRVFKIFMDASSVLVEVYKYSLEDETEN